MADVAKIYGVGDTVFVAYPFPNSLAFTPQSRVVKEVQILTGTNEALVFFESGEKVQDGADQTVFETQALCATKIVDDVIAKVDAAVALDVTTSKVSTGGATSLSLGRSDSE